MFAPRVQVKDTEVLLRNNEKTHVSSLAADVFQVLKGAGCNMQAVPKMTVLAAAARLSNGLPVPQPAAPVPPTTEDAPPAGPKKVTEPSPPAAPRTPRSTTKPVVVTTTRTSNVLRPTEVPVSVEVIHQYQCMIASAQLLAALHQLFERDTFPGHEQRKHKLEDLINDVESMSSQHVNLSVKAIIRNKATSQAPR